jgi:hypothetical protein
MLPLIMTRDNNSCPWESREVLLLHHDACTKVHDHWQTGVKILGVAEKTVDIQSLVTVL